jgi:nucleotide-binding universal stress UspA family protein
MQHFTVATRCIHCDARRQRVNLMAGVDEHKQSRTIHRELMHIKSPTANRVKVSQGSPWPAITLEKPNMKLLVAIDGSDASLTALRYVISHHAMFGAAPEVVLVNVHLPVPSPRIKVVLGVDVVEQYYREESEAALAPARALLDGTPCKVIERAIVGQPAEQIIAATKQHECELIVMGTHGRGAIGTLFMGSVAMRVIAESPVPVLSVK